MACLVKLKKQQLRNIQISKISPPTTLRVVCSIPAPMCINSWHFLSYSVLAIVIKNNCECTIMYDDRSPVKSCSFEEPISKPSIVTMSK